MQHACINSVRANTRSAEDCRLDAALRLLTPASNGNDPVAPEEGPSAPLLFFLSNFRASRPGRYKTPFYAHFYSYLHPFSRDESRTRYTDESKARVFKSKKFIRFVDLRMISEEFV